MKNYFKFNLTGNKLFPVWLIFMVLFLIPYIYVQFKLQAFKGHAQNQQEALGQLGEIFTWYGVMFVLIIIEYAILFFIAKLSIKSIQYKDESFSFVGTFGEFLSVYIPGFLLSIITIGIYSPWFMANMISFFAQKTSYKSDNLEFKGKGFDLFLIILFTLIIPMIVLMFGIGIFAFIAGMNGTMPQGDPTTNLRTGLYAAAMMFAIFLMVIPYIYYAYKWRVNFNFKSYNIQWETSFWSSAAKIALEILLSMITFGIYLPLASLKLYKYFAERTIAKSEAGSKKFGYDLEAGSDFLFIWGQLLLSLITLSIYYPWAFCKISDRILSKMYSEETEIEQESKLYISSTIADNLPSMVKNELDKMSTQKQEEFIEEYTRKAKSVGIAYLFLIVVLAMHYGYLRKWGLQIVFWITGGGFFIWWLIDLFRLPSLVKNYNKDIGTETMKNLKAMSN